MCFFSRCTIFHLFQVKMYSPTSFSTLKQALPDMSEFAKYSLDLSDSSTTRIDYIHIWLLNLVQLANVDMTDAEKKTVAEFCHLLEKSKQLFNGLRWDQRDEQLSWFLNDRSIVELKTLQGLAAVRPQTVAGVLRSHFRCLHKTLEVSATEQVSELCGLEHGIDLYEKSRTS